MRMALLCFGLFACSFIIQIIWWRLKRPLLQRRALLVLFTAVLVAFLASAAAIPGLATLRECLHLAVFYVPNMLSYVALYTAIEADSPSMTMVKFVAAAGKAGRSPEEFETIISNDNALANRIQAMVDESMAVRQGDTLTIAPKGESMARLFSLGARIFNIKKGG